MKKFLSILASAAVLALPWSVISTSASAQTPSSAPVAKPAVKSTNTAKAKTQKVKAKAKAKQKMKAVKKAA